MSREQNALEAKTPSRDLFSIAARALEYDPKEATQSSKPVVLAPWRQQTTPIIVILGVLIVEVAAVGFGAVLVLHPIKLPLGSNVALHLSVRSYNAIINLVSTVYAALVGISVAHGCRSHLGAKLVGGGVTLRQYERWFAVGNRSMVNRFAVDAILPALVLLVVTISSTAFAGVFGASTGSITTGNLALPYPDIIHNLALIASGEAYSTTLFGSEDFDGWVNAASASLVHGRVIDLDGVTSTVDGVRSSTGKGILPALLTVSTLTSQLNAPGNLPASRLSAAERGIVSTGTGNHFRVSVPVAVAEVRCSNGSMTFTASASNSNTSVTVMLSDPVCGTSSHVFFNSMDAFIGLLTCFSNGLAHTSFYKVEPGVGRYTALPTCAGSVLTGITSSAKYSDSQLDPTKPAYKLSKNASTALSDIQNVTKLAVDILNYQWIQNIGPRGSPTLAMLLTLASPDTGVAGMANVTVDQMSDGLAVLTRGLLSLAIVKLFNAVSFLESTTTGIVEGVAATELETFVTASCLTIGPSGPNAGYLAPLVATFILSFTAFVLTRRNPPTSIDPLNSISVMLVSQNSAPTTLADGGCLANPDHVRAPGSRIRLREVTSQHLAYVWGENAYEAPVMGRMYGSSVTGI